LDATDQKGAINLERGFKANRVKSWKKKGGAAGLKRKSVREVHRINR